MSNAADRTVMGGQRTVEYSSLYLPRTWTRALERLGQKPDCIRFKRD